ncbi:MAG: hypothetical protein UW27_C0004G0022 [Parcubacteria group bacterium GW2011_GWA1_44_13]|uniref:Uncharacterized protein n=1 Tax=Candidatus Nomurabacteria bacterium GW2011_GWB1_44_12 TaxID=1618748 RepID=A0A837I695_9BACT|nr:MAG: hypothetical protein UW25_C0005G0022 [Candidatus Nomurabacteria bacterium GW2011_GWB1_44_12]KKT38167.1 MAG: hypothetical protein UW27_C0004G0022 [Parcubacteria group bacterium GW2011_GWA1_44_13]HBB43826.1 hypothetical protein [Candidatus Yonathbacteria bacterium]
MANGKRKGHINGSKFCKHGKVTESAREVAEMVNKFPEVKKVSNGFLNGKGSSRFSMKFTEINGGWTIKIYGSHAVQELHVYTNNPAETRTKLEKELQKNLR